MSSRFIATAFGVYVLLLAGRDVVAEIRYDYVPREVIVPHVLVVVFVLSLAMLLWTGRWRCLRTKLDNPFVLLLSCAVSVLTLAIYAVTYFLIQTEIMGADLFNVIDFGLNPILLSAIGVQLFNEQPRRYIKPALAVFVIGIVIMFLRRPLDGALWIPVAVAGTTAMAVSDTICKYLLGSRQFQKLEMLVVRFAIPCAASLLYIAWFDWSVEWSVSVELVGYSILFAFLPLYVLYHVLGQADLSRLGRWEILLPLLVYAGTLHRHPDDLTWPPWPIFGALLVMTAFLACELLQKPRD